MKVSTYKNIILISLLSFLTFDFQLKFIYVGGLVYINDILLPVLLFIYLLNKPMKKWEVLPLIVIGSKYFFNL